MTEYSNEEIKNEALALKPLTYLTKPFNMTEGIALMQQTVRKEQIS